MDTYKSDEEQVETLKKWFKENGVSTLASIVIGIGAVFGWQFWQQSQQDTIDSSSAVYQGLLVQLSKAESQGDDISIATASHTAQSLKESYQGSGYSFFAALFQAQQAVADGDFDAAVVELQWVLDQKPQVEIRQITTLRLARVLFQQGNTDAAHQLLEQEDSGVFAHLYFEAKGDMLVHEQQYQSAVEAYQAARDKAIALEVTEPQTLETKLGYAKSFL